MELDLVRGAFDLHVHAAPDVVPRKLNDLDLAQAAVAAGMRGFLLKSHLGSTVERAYLVSHVEPRLLVAGGITLNESVGGLNVAAVDVALRLGARCVWMPTSSARHHRARDGGAGGITVFDEGNVLRSEVIEIVELIAHADVILATGHLAPVETMALADAAMAAGVTRFVVTHAEVAFTAFPVELQRRLARKGCFLEHAYVATRSIGGSVPLARLVQAIRAVGPAQSIVSTDLGQIDAPPPPAGMAAYLSELHGAGIPQQDLEQMAKHNPLHLVTP